MHSVLEGVVKSMFYRWFDQENSRMECSLRHHMQQIDKRILNIRPPKYVPTAPRSIYTWKTWRAHEYLSFIIYYSLPVFIDIMPDTTHFEHLVKLVVFLEIILSREIKKSDLNYAEKIIFEFVKDFNKIYSESSMLSGVHELLHLVDCTKYFGPLNLINLFPYEELNRKCIGVIHGRDLIGEELIKMFRLIQCLASTVSTFERESKLIDFIKKQLMFKTSNRKRINLPNAKIVVKLLSKKEILDEPNILNTIHKKIHFQLEDIFVFTKIDVNGIIYTSSKFDTKYCDSCFYTTDGIFGNIEYFFNHNDKFYVIAKQINRLYNPFYWNEESPQQKASISYCCVTNNIIVEEIINLKKCALIKIDENKFFISTFNTSHLFN